MSIDDLLRRTPVIPVIVIDDLAQAVPLARALLDGGLPVLEVTLRSKIATQAIAEITDTLADAIVGAGTLTNPQQFDEVGNAGAKFAVSPGLTDALVAGSRDCSLPFLPGVFTPGEAMRASDLGFRTLKLYPAEQAGGVAMLRALKGPLPHLKFCPTGGIGAHNFSEYLRLPNVVCVGGSWVCPADAIEKRDWGRISKLAAEVRAAVRTETAP